MLRAQRRVHAWIWFLLAPLALVIILSALLTRPRDAESPPLAAPSSE